jgi:hypothetical protein
MVNYYIYTASYFTTCPRLPIINTWLKNPGCCCENDPLMSHFERAIEKDPG